MATETVNDPTREVWLLANRRMTDAALKVARWVELHPGASASHKSLYPLMTEFVDARRVVLELIAEDHAPAAAPVPGQRRHLSLVK